MLPDLVRLEPMAPFLALVIGTPCPRKQLVVFIVGEVVFHNPPSESMPLGAPSEYRVPLCYELLSGGQASGPEQEGMTSSWGKSCFLCRPQYSRQWCL